MDTNQLIAFLVGQYTDDMQLKSRIRRCNKYLNERIAKTIYFIDRHRNENKILTDNSIKNLYQLRKLILYKYDHVTDNVINNFLNLQELCVSNEFITDISLQKLPQLKILSLKKTNITNNGIANLSNLRSLTINNNRYITDEGIQKLSKLEFLTLSVTNITDEGIKNLKRLKKLLLFNKCGITNMGLQDLSKLGILVLDEDQDITSEFINNMKNIEVLGLYGYANERYRNLLSFQKIDESHIKNVKRVQGLESFFGSTNTISINLYIRKYLIKQ